jgi:hypothetical protein
VEGYEISLAKGCYFDPKFFITVFLIQSWVILCPQNHVQEFTSRPAELKKLAIRPMRLM